MDPTIVYRSEAMSKAMALAERVAATDASVLITGESGTGKSLLAELIHRQSRRRGRPFVTIPCANIPAELFESEMFGHEPGAHTDAVERRRGRFEAADGGTVFLDGVGALALSLQPKLLRVLQDLTFERLGGTKEIKVDVRIIAAADEGLEAAARAGRFREDLFYRLNVVHVSLPPLRERVSDIAPLASYFLKRLAARYGGRPRRLTIGARRGLRDYSWPGNVRELANVLESSVIGSDNGLIGTEGLALPRGTPAESAMREALANRWNLERLEATYIREVLKAEGGNKSRAASVLGIDRKTLHVKLKKGSSR